MNLAYWGFQYWPFERTFAAERFFADPAHEEALARLLFLVEEFHRTGIVVGPTGTGKTFLLKLVQRRAERLGRQTVRCEATGLDGDELITQIAHGCHVQFDAEAKTSRIWNAMQTRFSAMALIEQSAVILIDHFDLSDTSCQRAVCRMRQLADAVGLKLTIVLATRERTIPAILHDVVELRIEVAPWTALETSSFINTAVAQAGSREILFTDEAIESVYMATSGVPANVVTMCSLALLGAMSQGETLVTREIIEASGSELMSRSNATTSDLKASVEQSILAASLS